MKAADTITPVDSDLNRILSKQGYFFIVQIPGKGICAVKQFFSDWYLCYGITQESFKGSYTYEDMEKAILGLNDYAKQLEEFGEVRLDPRDRNWTVHSKN